MTLIVRMPDLKLFFGFRFISINTVVLYYQVRVVLGQSRYKVDKFDL